MSAAAGDAGTAGAGAKGARGRVDPDAGKNAAERGAARRTGTPARKQVADLLSGTVGTDDTAAAKPGAQKAAGSMAGAASDGKNGDADHRAPGEAGDAAANAGTAEKSQNAGDDGSAAGDGERTAQDAAAKPKTWKEAAEKLGLEPEELYALELNLSGDRGSTTLGAIKDLIQTHGTELPEISALIGQSKKDREEASRERESVNLEANMIRRDVVAVMGAMGQVPPEVLAQVRTAQARRTERELRLVLDSTPEWRDPRVFAQDRAEMFEPLRKYGLSKAEFDLIDDSRVMLFFRDLMRSRRAARAAIRDAGDSAANVQSTTHQPTGRGASTAHTSAAARNAAARAGSRHDKARRVSELLSQGK